MRSYGGSLSRAIILCMAEAWDKGAEAARNDPAISDRALNPYRAVVTDASRATRENDNE